MNFKILFLIPLFLIVSCYQSPIVLGELELDIMEGAEIFYIGCDVNDLVETHFLRTDLLTFNTRVTVVSDSTTTVDSSTVDGIMDILKADLLQHGVHFHLMQTDTLMLKDVFRPMYYKDLLKVVMKKSKGDRTFLNIVVVPQGVRFKEEENLPPMRKIQGAALHIPSTIMFIREEVSHTSITTHEMLHCLGLYHMFTRPDDSEKGYDSSTGDFVCDTPKSDGGAKISLSCNYFPVDSNYTLEEMELMATNYMSYSPAHCLDTMTVGQVDKVFKTIELTPALTDCLFEDEEDRVDIDAELSVEQSLYGIIEEQ